MSAAYSERLQKVLASAGLCSRRTAETWILAGRVKINGVIVRELGVKVSRQDVVEVDDKLIDAQEKVYYLFYKPRKVLCTSESDGDRSKVVDYFPKDKRVFTVGRLDYDTSGLLLVTNDGDFAQQLIHPSHEVEKTYEVRVRGILEATAIKALEQGIMLDGRLTQKTKVKVTHKDFSARTTSFTIRLHEGRNRQIRRMCEAVGAPVSLLHRSRFAFLTLGDLKPGEYRLLKPFERQRLLALAKQGQELR
ncbi:MAG: rRNA pseudouridine synthase [Erysipelotrichaceae bacterium]|jgi:23S rRNA pseudouridine2605 synthase|nr:rRNA pseudouridine synthase [Erysipelotrichaceae bacterium]